MICWKAFVNANENKKNQIIIIKFSFNRLKFSIEGTTVFSNNWHFSISELPRRNCLFLFIGLLCPLDEKFHVQLVLLDIFRFFKKIYIISPIDVVFFCFILFQQIILNFSSLFCIISFIK